MIQIQVKFIDNVVTVFAKCRSLCKTVEVPQVPFVAMVIVVLIVFAKRGGP